eukprot:8179656-Alexandrium_andersonii.AAC.1
MTRKQMNKMPEHKRPVQKVDKYAVDQYAPGGYRKGRLIAACRVGMKVVPVWKILENMGKMTKAESIIVPSGFAQAN